MKRGLLTVLGLGVVLMSAKPAAAGILDGFGNFGFFSYLEPVLRWLGLGLMRLIYLIPGGEDMLISIF